MAFNIGSVTAMSRANGLQAYSDLIKEMDGATIPALENYGRFIKAHKAQAKQVEQTNRVLAGSVSKDWPTFMADILKAHVKMASKIEDVIEEVVPKQAEIEGLGSQAVQIALYIDTLYFVSSYCRKLVMVETDDIGQKIGAKVESTFSPADLKAIRADWHAFTTAVTQVKALAKQDVAETIRKVPDFRVEGADLDAMNATYGGKANPLAQGFISASWNPIFFIRSRFNDRQIKRYHVAKEERQNLEFKIKVLEQQIEDEGESPALQRELEYQTGRLKRLTDELEDVEDKAKKEPGK